jgi:hypothetical protein
MTYQERVSSRNFGTKYPRSQGEIADKYIVFSAMTVLKWVSLKDLWYKKGSVKLPFLVVFLFFAQLTAQRL